MLKLVTGFLQINLRLRELANIRRGNIITAHLYRGLDFRVQINHLRFEPFFVFSQQLFSGHDLRDRLIEIRNTVPHVADSLLKYELWVLSLFDDPAKKRAHRTLHSCPHSHFILRLKSDSKIRSDLKAVVENAGTPSNSTNPRCTRLHF